MRKNTGQFFWVCTCCNEVASEVDVYHVTGKRPWDCKECGESDFDKYDLAELRERWHGGLDSDVLFN